MREMLFKGKRLDNGKWIEGNLFKAKRYSTDIWHYYILPMGVTYEWGYWGAELQTWEVDPDTVREYTGLRDKNGKRIFEGDIVKAQDNLIFSPFCDGLVGKVVYIETAFFIEPKDPTKSEYLFNECAVYEVLGNIHDNPELMEER